MANKEDPNQGGGESRETFTRESVRKGLDISNNVAPVLANPADALPSGSPVNESPQASAPSPTPVASSDE